MDVVIQDCKIWLPGQDNLQNSKSYFQLFYQKYPPCHLKKLPNNGKYPLGQSMSYHSNFILMLSRLQRICYSHWANGARNGVISIGQWGVFNHEKGAI